MTLEQYWNILIKRWWLILISFVAVGVRTFYVSSKLITPLYQSTTVIQITAGSSSNQTDYGNLLASDQLVQTEVQLATSDPVLREVASHYPGLTVEQLSGEVTARVKANTQLFEIDVLDPSPTRAAGLANDIATTLLKQQTPLAQQSNSQARQKIQQDLQHTQQQINSTTNKITALQTIKRGNQQAQIDTLNKQLAALQEHLSQQQLMLAQLQLTQIQTAKLFVIAQQAQPPSRPAYPNVPLNTAAGFMAGLLQGLLLVVLLELVDTRVRTAKALTQLLKWPILATIWRVDTAKETVVNPPGRSANSEAYRMLHTKDFQAYFDAGPTEKLLQVSHIDASIQSPAGDSIFLVDANTAQNKANQYIVTTVNDQVTVDMVGTATHQAVIKFTWTDSHLTGNPFFGPLRYRDYLRVYAPPNSTLQKFTGWPTLEDTGTLFGREFWGGKIEVSYPVVGTITLTWSVPGAATQDAQGWHYHFLLQRQAGAQETMDIGVTFPACATIVGKSTGVMSDGNQKVHIAQLLSQDTNVSVDYRC